MLDFLRALVGDTLSFAAYAALFAGVYKLFQVSTALDEIKELLTSQRRNDFLAQGPAAPAVASGHVLSSDALSDEAAAEYAKNLLRAVNAEEQHAAAEHAATEHAGTN
jgi:hypothetical protein